MIWVQEFCVWWFVNVFSPYGEFVYVDNLVWATLIVGVASAILTGLFYKPGDPWWYGRFMEHYGFPALIIFFSAVTIPTGSLLIMWIMPILILISGILLPLIGLHLGLKKWKECRDDYVREQLHRLEQERREER